MRFLVTALGLGALVFFAFWIISLFGLVESHLMRNVIGTNLLGREEGAPGEPEGAESGVRNGFGENHCS